LEWASCTSMYRFMHRSATLVATLILLHWYKTIGVTNFYYHLTFFFMIIVHYTNIFPFDSRLIMFPDYVIVPPLSQSMV